jgi:P4 family phage/plasmid primase-like protien
MNTNFEVIFRLFFHPGEITEIRAKGLSGKSPYYEGYAGKKSTVSGYFDNAADFARAAEHLDSLKPIAIWFILNPPDNALFARAPNRLVAFPDATTRDKDIQAIRWLYIDIDPKRPSGVSSTNEEMDRAKIVAGNITEWLEKGALKFPRGLRAWSGNGYHLLYRLPDLANNEDSAGLVKNAGAAIEEQFRSEHVEIDLSVSNPGSMAKLYGTTVHKGFHTEERPHRKSALFPDQPETLDDVPIVPIEAIQKLAAMAPKTGQYPPAQEQGQNTGQVTRMRSNLGTLDIAQYLSHYKVPFSKKDDGVRTIFRLERCLFDENHGKNEAAIIQSPEKPYLAYHCMHTSCKKYTWKDARAKISGDDSLAPFMSNFNPEWQPQGQTYSDITVKVCAVEPGENTTAPGPLDVEPWEFFDRRGKRPSFVPRLLANYMLAYLQHIVYTDGAFWHYNKGVWKPFGRDLLEHIATLALKTEASGTRIDNAVKVFRGLVNLTEKAWPKTDKYINCLNGMVNLRTGELLPHKPGYGSKIQIQARFDPDAKCERWLDYLDEVFPEDRTSKKGRKSELLRQFFGYCLLPDCRFQKGMFLYGPGSNGKSKALEALINIVGKENTSTLSISDLSQRFKAQFLENKLVNVSTETNTRDPIGTEIYKAAIRGEPITAERKYGEPYLFTPVAKWLVAMNDSPVIPDKSYGFVRSVIVLNFTRRFEKHEIDELLGEKLAKEKDGIFMWALFGLKTLLQNGGFAIPQSVAEEGENFMKTMNPALIYIEENCDVGPDCEIGSKELYKDYQKWCIEGGNKALSRNKFIDQILMNYPGVRKCKIGPEHSRIRGFAGLTVKFDL